MTLPCLKHLLWSNLSDVDTCQLENYLYHNFYRTSIKVLRNLCSTKRRGKEAYLVMASSGTLLRKGLRTSSLKVTPIPMK